MYSYGPPHMAEQKQDDHLEHTYSSYVGIWDVAQRTCQRRWTTGKSGETVSGIFVLAARHYYYYYCHYMALYQTNKRLVHKCFVVSTCGFFLFFSSSVRLSALYIFSFPHFFVCQFSASPSFYISTLAIPLG